jgi:beta-glucosidase
VWLKLLKFEYSDLKLDKNSLSESNQIIATIQVINSNILGKEVVQMYIRDLIGSLTRPL